MFRGFHEISLDAKGRLVIPARYRELLKSHCDGKLVATIDIQYPCLRIYPLPVWEELEDGLPSGGETTSFEDTGVAADIVEAYYRVIEL